MSAGQLPDTLGVYAGRDPDDPRGRLKVEEGPGRVELECCWGGDTWWFFVKRKLCTIDGGPAIESQLRGAVERGEESDCNLSEFVTRRN